MSKDPKTEKPRDGLSRRDFFRSGTVGAVSGAILAQQEGWAKAEAGTAIWGPAEVEIQLMVDGKKRRLSVEPRVTLLDALRNRLDVTAPKKVCDRATCGACTVLLDDKPVYACSVLAIEAQGHQITTTEGLGSPQDLHPVQKAFVENDAQQCGFCTPGFVVAAQAFLEKNPNPSVEEIKKGLGGNLCRCGTYMGVRDAVLQAAGKEGSDA